MGLKEFFQNSEKKVNSYKPIKNDSKEDKSVGEESNAKLKNDKEVEVPSIQKNVPKKEVIKDNEQKEEVKAKDNVILSSSTQKVIENIKSDKKEKGLLSGFWNREYKETVKKTLYLFLIEDTAEMVNHNDKVFMLYSMVPKESLICFIHYGSSLYNSGVLINSQKVR